MHYEGSRQLGAGAQFLRTFPWWKLESAPHRANYHANAEDFYDPYVAEMGEDVLFYFTTVGFFYRNPRFTILGLDRDKTYTYQFFDPITGKRYAAQELIPDADGNWTVPNPPIMQDWVGWIHAEE